MNATYLAATHLGHHFTGTVQAKSGREAMEKLIAKVRSDLDISVIASFSYCIDSEMQRLTINEVSEIFFS